jgi:hypothetical protein
LTTLGLSISAIITSNNNINAKVGPSGPSGPPGLQGPPGKDCDCSSNTWKPFLNFSINQDPDDPDDPEKGSTTAVTPKLDNKKLYNIYLNLNFNQDTIMTMDSTFIINWPNNLSKPSYNQLLLHKGFNSLLLTGIKPKNNQININFNNKIYLDNLVPNDYITLLYQEA